MSKTIVISVGGNALSNDPKKDAVLLAPVSKLIVQLYKKGYKILLTTGNGPQSGEIFNIICDANKQNAKHLLLPLDEANSMSQSYIGYHVNKSLMSEMIKNKLEPNVCCLQTLTLVNEKDPA
jgi:carbamate kinase